MDDFYEFIGRYIDTDLWFPILLNIRLVAIILAIIIFAVFIFVFIKAIPYRPKIHPKHSRPGKVFTLKDAIFKERWMAVVKKFSSGSPDIQKLAVIEADKVVDDVLKKLGLEGEHMADRLEKINPGELLSLDRIWRAHRFRNNLVHSPDFQASTSDFKKALDDYETFLKEISILQ